VKLFSSKHLAQNSDPSLNRLQFLKKAGHLALGASTLAFLASCVGNNSQTSEDQTNPVPGLPGNPGGSNPGLQLTQTQLELNYLAAHPQTRVLRTSGSQVEITDYNFLWQSWINGSALNATQKANLLDRQNYLPGFINQLRASVQYQTIWQFQNYHESNFYNVYVDLFQNGYIPTQYVEYREKQPVGMMNTLTETGLSIVMIPFKFQSQLKGLFLHYLNSSDLSQQNFSPWVNLEDFGQ